MVVVDIVLTAELVGEPVAEQPQAATPTSARDAAASPSAAPESEPAAAPAAISVRPLRAIPVEDVPPAVVSNDSTVGGRIPAVLDHGVTRRLWLVRRAFGAGSFSALVHTLILIGLGYVAADHVRPAPAVFLHDEPRLEASVARIEKPQPIEKPILIPSVAAPKTVGTSKGAQARGTGSDGRGGGRGGGTLGGAQLAGVRVGPVELHRSGGTGLGIDKAFGADMLGEAGEPVPSGATFFGIKADGRNFAFVVDTSGSMLENSRYLRCRNELMNSLSSLKYGQKYYVVFFNDQLFPMPGNKLVEAKPQQLLQTKQWITGAVPTGGTEPWPGLSLVMRMKPDAIYLLSDGHFDPGTVDRVVLLQQQSKKIPIHTIAFESEAGEITLKAISRVTGGTYKFVP